MKINPKWQSIDTLSGPARPILITSAGNTTVCHNYNPLKNLNVFHLFKPTHFCEVPPFYLYPIEAEFDCCQKCSEREQKLQDENQALRDQVAKLAPQKSREFDSNSGFHVDQTWTDANERRDLVVASPVNEPWTPGRLRELAEILQYAAWGRRVIALRGKRPIVYFPNKQRLR